MGGYFESAVVKVNYGGHIRKWKLNAGSKLNDLINTIRYKFGVEGLLHLKYKDSEGDYIQLTSDKDLALAIALEKNLFIVASNESDDLPKSVAEFRSSLNSLIATSTDLFNSLDNLIVTEKKSNVVSTRDALSSPVKSEQIASIDPSVFEEVHLNDLPNETVYEEKLDYYNEIQFFQPLKSAHLNETSYWNDPPVNLTPVTARPVTSYTYAPVNLTRKF